MRIVIILALALCLRADAPPMPIPIVASDQQEYFTAVREYQDAMLHFQKIAYHACLDKGLTLPECGQVDPNGRGVVAVFPKPEASK